MNMNTVLFLVNKNIRGMRVAYEWCDEDGGDVNGKPVKTDLFKTLDSSIRKGDLVLGETQSRHKMCVYRVVEADVEVDLEWSGYIPWIVGSVSSNLHEMKHMEDELSAVIRRKDKDKKRAELAETMMKDYGEEVRKLQISNAGSDTQLSPPEQPPSND